MKPNRRTWLRKFSDAFRGTWVAFRDNSSFWVHVACALGVAATAWFVRLGPVRWSILLLCISLVLGIEALNTALEEMAKAVDKRFNPHVRDALDIGSAAVLIVALGAVIVGGIVLLPPLLTALGRW